MIHYHGTPIGGPREAPARFLAGRHALVPMAYQDDLGIVAEVCQSFVFDNSAFTTWKLGKRVDRKKYVEWCLEWSQHPGFDWALIPDEIDGDLDNNKRFIDEWPHDKVEGVPVYHIHEPVEWARELATSFRRIALGSSGAWPTPGAQSWWKRMAVVMNAITDSSGRPLCKLHGLRMLSPKIVSAIPPASADSTNAGRNCNRVKRFGMYTPPTAAQRATVIGDRIESVNSPAVWSGAVQEVLPCFV